MARKRAAKEAESPPGPPMTDAERAELDARLDRMISKPNKADTGAGFFLLWTQRDAADQARVMIWHPETEDEIRSANLFHDAAHGLGDFARAVKKEKSVRRAAEETALINAILQNRADDTGYLVYADYLTENGNPQGDFIRLCVEIERLPPDHPERVEKINRREALLAAHGEDWYAPLGRLGPRPDIFGTFAPWLWLSAAHGVIDEVVIDRSGLLPESAARLFAAAPFLRKLEFTKGHLNLTGLAKVKQLAQIDELDLSTGGSLVFGVVIGNGVCG
ncbi:TIGR02996 domain-containing protein [Frigoriglobus tundricola]|uniref:Uncharacterized protein n=1 Tax=Frigoriglobus tundricola TaxID=2774151 RepID=A0A6M5YZI4_9BACT|nr:TIGR02996 domain-containing protein [Frigoriglobus tundricola]QJW99365.1 hypothetical protein FTUN_6973 [Frigoriglobus tundricola]